VAGDRLGGGKLDLADYRGKVVVLNLWWSLCPPCRSEQPMLAGAARDLMAQGVAVMGINTRDAAQSGPIAYQRSFKVPYPSIFDPDDPDGQTLLAFKAYVSPNAIPSTLVIDKEGRVAAVVLGELPSRTTLLDLVQDAGGPKVTSS
jgi:thiol-disulfide isomerase/thioredoxin